MSYNHRHNLSSSECYILDKHLINSPRRSLSNVSTHQGLYRMISNGDQNKSGIDNFQLNRNIFSNISTHQGLHRMISSEDLNKDGIHYFKLNRNNISNIHNCWDYCSNISHSFLQYSRHILLPY